MSPLQVFGTRSFRFFALIFSLQSISLLLYRHQGSRLAQIQRITTDRHSSATVAVSNNVTIQDFGLMGKKVATLGDLAQHYVDNPSLDSSSLSDLVAKQFNWWNGSALHYFPWKDKPWHDRPLSDLKLFGAKTGIVICTGDGNAKEAAHLIVYLRNVHKSKLPIEIAYIGDDDLTPRSRAFLSGLADDIQFIDLNKAFNDSLVRLGGWATKPFALLASRYPQTILLDADAVLFSRPDNLFKDYPSLRETGALFFHDRSMRPGGPTRQDWLEAQLEAAGQRPSAHLRQSSLFYRRYIGEEADAAVVCIDKSRPKTYMAMVFACWMNIEEVRNAVTWDIWYGDKESYWLATELTGVPYAFEPWSSARMAQSTHQGAKMIPSDISERSPERAGRMKLVDWYNELPTEDTQSEHEVPPADKRCTTHMVHPTASGNEPLWANGGLWLDKRDKSLGLANWTHWYLGTRIDKALSDIGPNLLSPIGMSASIEDDESNEELRRSQHDQIMATQPVWYNQDWGEDAKCLPQHDETGWKRLNLAFRTRLQRMIEEVRQVEVSYKEHFG